MVKLVEISNHFVDESTGVSGYVAGGIVYLNLGDEAVTRERFLKTAIRYVGFNTSTEKLREYTDIYDDANRIYVDKKIEVDKEVSNKSFDGVDISSKISGSGGNLDVADTSVDSENKVVSQKPSRRRSSSRAKTSK